MSTNDPPLIKLGQNIKFHRSSNKLSQEKLAEICGFDRTYISLIERGKRNISFTNLLKVAVGLDTSVSDLTKGI